VKDRFLRLLSIISNNFFIYESIFNKLSTLVFLTKKNIFGVLFQRKKHFNINTPKNLNKTKRDEKGECIFENDSFRFILEVSTLQNCSETTSNCI
jgi:hypothetical protein